jgi:peptide/nickel transport system substrate-binding protein
LLCLGGAAAEEKTLRWAARGDVLSMDPHAVNEGLTNNVVEHVYELLVTFDRDQRLVPNLAESWTVVNDTTWRIKVRRDVRFHDGSPFTAADVVFSIERAQQPTSRKVYFARRLGRPLLIDDHTVELRLETPNPLLLQHLFNVPIMSRAWCIAHGVERVPSFKDKQEAHSSRHAMGTGPFTLERHEPGTRTVMVRNPNWWGRFEGNVGRFVYTPIANDATRSAALMSGGIDFTHDAPLQDAERLARNPSLRLWTGPERRVVFFGMDQFREELLYANVKGRNPFKDVRVREAFYRAIDADALRSGTMRGQSAPTACMTPDPTGCLATELEKREPPDAARARQLMAQAGYAKGFALTLDCPNDRYVNDQAICVAVAAMLGRIGVKVRVNTQPKTVYFKKIQHRDTSFYMFGWGGGTSDAQTVMDPILHSPDSRTEKGDDNHSRYQDPELDRLIDAAGVEMNVTRRAELIAEALRRTHRHFYYLPLHRQMLTWASRAHVHPVLMPDNEVRVHWIRVD